MIVIGITGTLGAGKGTIVDFLVHEKGFLHYSVRQFLIDEIVKRNLPVNRDSMTSVANNLRKDHSPSYITDELFKRALISGRNCVIESIRTPGEIESLRLNDKFYLIAIDANPDVRFQRIKLRQSETDQIDLPTFLSNEAREMDSADPNHQNLRRCIEMADFIFLNNGTVIELIKDIEQTLSQILES